KERTQKTCSTKLKAWWAVEGDSKSAAVTGFNILTCSVRSRAHAALRTVSGLLTQMALATVARARYGGDGAYVPENNAFTDSRESTTIVNTPRTVPNGTKKHWMQAITRANE